MNLTKLLSQLYFNAFFKWPIFMGFSLFFDFTFYMPYFSLLSGFSASILHVVSGPDHLAAVTPLAIESRRKVWQIGLLWGFGHLTGMVLIGLLFLLFKEYIPLEQISEYSEQLVGFVLVTVGVWALFRLFTKGINHRHPHIHNGDEPYIHVHEHQHGKSVLELQHTHHKKKKQNLWSSFAIGVLHGLAGIAHFILLLPILGFENRADSILYIFGFAFGTVLAMTAYTFLFGLLAYISKKKKHTSLLNTIRLSGGLFALGIGVYWIYLSF